MGHNFKETAKFNIDQEKYNNNYERIFGKKKDETKPDETIMITKSKYEELLEIKAKYEDLCR